MFTNHFQPCLISTKTHLVLMRLFCVQGNCQTGVKGEKGERGLPGMPAPSSESPLENLNPIKEYYINKLQLRKENRTKEK